MPALAVNPDIVQHLIRQKQLQDFAAPKFSVDLDTANIDPETAVEWVFTKDTKFAGISGASFYRRGQHITYMPLIRQLRNSNADILPVR